MHQLQPKKALEHFAMCVRFRRKLLHAHFRTTKINKVYNPTRGAPAPTSYKWGSKWPLVTGVFHPNYRGCFTPLKKLVMGPVPCRKNSRHKRFIYVHPSLTDGNLLESVFESVLTHVKLMTLGGNTDPKTNLNFWWIFCFVKFYVFLGGK